MATRTTLLLAIGLLILTTAPGSAGMKNDTVATLSLDNARLGKQIIKSEQQVQNLTQENFHLKEQLERKIDSEETSAKCNEDLKQQLENEKKKVEVLTHEIADLKKQLEERDGEVTVKCMLAAGYQHYPGFSYYKYYSEAMSFDDALKSCNDSGAHLGVINSEGEAGVFRDILAKGRDPENTTWNNYFFVGVLDPYRTRRFETPDGVSLSEVGYTKWQPGQPDNFGGHENCLTITKEALLNDLTCSEKTAFICEWEHL